MKFHRIYALSIRHLYLIKSSFPRILDLIYWPTIQIFFGVLFLNFLLCIVIIIIILLELF